MFFDNNNYSSRYNTADYGGEPYVTDLKEVALQNPFFRRALWTGKHLQLTIMNIVVGEEIGLESHNNLDQFLYIESGYALVVMGASPDKLNYQVKIDEGYAIFVPAGTYHNVINIGNTPLKLFSIYSPPNHPKGILQETKEIAESQEKEY